MWRDSIRFLQRIKFILEKNTKLKTDILKLGQSPSDIDKSLEVKDISRSEILYTKGLDITMTWLHSDISQKRTESVLQEWLKICVKYMSHWS